MAIFQKNEYRTHYSTFKFSLISRSFKKIRGGPYSKVQPPRGIHEL